MLTPTLNIHDVPQAIQLALGPVFLLTGIAGLLNVMMGRLARIVDRGRQLVEGDGARHSSVAVIHRELEELERRRHLASAAITASVFAALAVCVVIAALFLEVLLDVPLKWLVGLLFTGGTLALVVGLAFFLREVQLATRTIRFWPPTPPVPPPPA